MTKKTRDPKKLRNFKEMLEMPANDGQASSPPPPKKKANPEICTRKLRKTSCKTLQIITQGRIFVI